MSPVQSLIAAHRQGRSVGLYSVCCSNELVLRAAAGDCINVTLENRLPLVMPDLPAYAVMQGMVKRDRFSALGSTTFNNNLMRPSSHVGLHAQLLSYDITKSDGFNVGSNMTQTVPPRAGSSGAYPSRTYQYYAGHLEREGKPVVQLGRNLDRIDAYPIEFGGLNLLPADPIKQGQKGLAGAMSIAPAAATWVEDPGMRAAATVTAPGQPNYRDFSLIWHKSLNLRWANGMPVENMASEGPGIPNDPKDNSGMAVNYRRKARGALRASAHVPDIEAGPARDVHVRVDVRDAADDVVFDADITMWISPKD